MARIKINTTDIDMEDLEKLDDIYVDEAYLRKQTKMLRKDIKRQEMIADTAKAIFEMAKATTERDED